PRNDVSIYFEPNRTRLTEAARRELDEVVAVLREHPEAPVSIVGHTALYGTEDGRLEISQGRAQAVAAYLRSLGWEAQTEPSIAWVGSQNPVTREQDEQERNRRVEITIGGDGAAP
ncbi:MAG: OmpA family protein, partial [Alkalispirochaeta sp.]